LTTPESKRVRDKKFARFSSSKFVPSCMATRKTMSGAHVLTKLAAVSARHVSVGTVVLVTAKLGELANVKSKNAKERDLIESFKMFVHPYHNK